MGIRTSPVLNKSLSEVARSPAVLLMLFVVAGFVLRATGSNFGLPMIFHADEPHVVEPTLHFHTGDLNPHTFVYTSFFMYFQYVVQRIYYLFAGLIAHVEPSRAQAYLIGRLLSAGFGAATIAVVYLIGRRMFNEKIAITAALLFVMAPSNVQHSHFATTDVALTFFVALGFYVGWLLAETGKLKFYIWGGIVTGIAISTKIPGVFLVPVLVVAHAIYIKRKNRFTIRQMISEQCRSMRSIVVGVSLALALGAVVFVLIKHFRQILELATPVLPAPLIGKFSQQVVQEVESLALIYAAGAAIALLGIFALRGLFFKDFRKLLAVFLLAPLVFILTSPYAVIDWELFLRDFTNAMLLSKTTWGGKFAGTSSGLIYNLSFLRFDFGFLLLSLACLAGIGLGFRSKRKSIYVASFVIPYYLYISSWQIKFSRYLVPLAPFVVLVASWGFLAALDWLQRKRPSFERGKLVAYGACGLLFAFSGLLFSADRSLLYLHGFLQADTRQEALQWVEDHVPKGAHILREAYTPEVEVAGYDRVTNVLYDFAGQVDSTYVHEKDVDFIIISDSMYSRYLANRELQKRYRGYQNIEKYAILVKEVNGDVRNGPTIRIYRVRRGS